LPAAVRKLVRLAERNNTEVWLRDVTSDIGIPTFVASLRSWDADGIEFPAMGLGCDPNAAIAAIRAITEAAQGRNVAIQGVREDARAVQALRPRAANERALSCCDGTSTIPFHQISAYQNDDILDDLNLMIGRLKAVGVREAYAVDLTDPEIPASVARVIVPDMESWFLTDFKPESCALGWRATRYLGLSGENLNPAYAGQA
jgi:ribosomal protein S12 methylthiotransferase accessory factor